MRVSDPKLTFQLKKIIYSFCYSVLRLQFKRSEYLANYLTEEDFDLDPSNHGWCIENGSYEVLLQDPKDPFYTVAKSIQVSCSCVSDCRNCKCRKAQEVEGQCSRLTCKRCACFKRIKEGSEENLALSTDYQRYMDGLSDDEEESIENEEQESDECEEDETELGESDEDLLPDIPY